MRLHVGHCLMTERDTYIVTGISFMYETDQFSSLCVLSNAAAPDDVRSKIWDAYGPLTLCSIYVETAAEFAPYGCEEQRDYWEALCETCRRPRKEHASWGVREHPIQPCTAFKPSAITKDHTA